MWSFNLYRESISMKRSMCYTLFLLMCGSLAQWILFTTKLKISTLCSRCKNQSVVNPLLQSTHTSCSVHLRSLVAHAWDYFHVSSLALFTALAPHAWGFVPLSACHVGGGPTTDWCFTSVMITKTINRLHGAHLIREALVRPFPRYCRVLYPW